MATKIEVLKATILSLGGSFDDIDATDEAALSKRLIEVCGKLQNPGGSGGGSSLPTGGEPYQQLVTDGEGNAVWEERLAYESGGVVEVLPETALTNEEEGVWMLLGTTPVNVVPGEVYMVTYNGITYTLTAGEMDFDGPMAYLGNAGVFGGDNTGEPFAALIPPAEIVQEQGLCLTLISMDGVTSVTLSISHDGTEVHTIPQKYLPGYLYGSDTEPVVCLEQDTYTLSGSGSAAYITKAFSPALAAGDIYTVDWNGTTYTCTGVAGDYGVFLGATTESEQEEFPFQILCAYTPSSDGTTTVTGQIRTYEDLESVTLSITRTEKIKKVPQKYLDVAVAEPLIITVVGTTNTTTPSVDYTFDEIKKAFDAGRTLVCRWADHTSSTGETWDWLPLVRYSSYSGSFDFRFIDENFRTLQVSITKSVTTIKYVVNTPSELRINSVNGYAYKITVSDDGTLSTTAVE